MLESTISIISLIIGLLLGYFLCYYSYRKSALVFNSEFKNQEERYLHIIKELEDSFKSIASDVTQSNSTEFLKLANENFSDLSKKSESTLNQKKELLELEIQL